MAGDRSCRSCVLYDEDAGLNPAGSIMVIGKTAGADNRVTSAMSVMVVAMLMIPVMDVLAKWLATEYQQTPASITFWRFFVQTILMALVIIIRLRTLKVRPEYALFNIVRGLLIGCASMLFFIAVKYMPIADAISIFFVEPIFVMFLSWMLLNETVGRRRFIAAIFGFSGAILVIQPSFSDFGPIALLPLCAAVLFAFYLILTRKSGVQDDPLKMQLFSGIGGVLFCSLALGVGELTTIENLHVTLPGSGMAFVWLVMIGAIAAMGHLLIVMAFSMAPASVLAPFQYVEIVSATILGLLIFGDFPSPLKWLGTAIIIGSGLYIFWREQQTSASNQVQ